MGQKEYSHFAIRGPTCIEPDSTLMPSPITALIRKSIRVKGPSFTDWAQLKAYEEAEQLTVTDCCYYVTTTGTLDHLLLFLTQLQLSDCTGIEILRPGNLRHLIILTIEDCKKLRKVDVSGLNALQTLRLSDCPSVEVLELNAEVTSLSLERCQVPSESLSLCHCAGLEELTLSQCSGYERVELPTDLKNLRKPHLNFCGTARLGSAQLR